MPDVLVVPCSIRPGALSPRVARLVAEALERRGQTVRSWNLRELPPHGWTAPDEQPASVQAWRDAVAGARAIAWVTPTYHNEMPGVAKSALDHLDARVMRGRLNGIVGASTLSGEPGAISMGQVIRFIGGILPIHDLYVPNLREAWPRDVPEPPESLVGQVEAWVDRLLGAADRLEPPG